MAISSSENPRGNSSATSKLLPLNDHLSFSSLLKTVYFFSYFECGFIRSTSKATTNGIPMVVIIVQGLMKCKLQAGLWTSPCSPPRLPPLREIPSHVIVVCN
jgi:hypothetical protein